MNPKQQFEYRNSYPGYSKEAQKEVYKYQVLQRYEQNPETEAIVNAKFQYVPSIGFILLACLVQRIIFQDHIGDNKMLVNHLL